MQRPYALRACLISLTLVFMLAGPAAAFAQISSSTEHREWEFTGFAGQSVSNDHEFPTQVTGSGLPVFRTVGMNYDSGYQVGARVSENVSEFWGVDLEYSLADQDLTFINVSPQIQHLS